MTWAVVILGVTNALSLILIVFQQISHTADMQTAQSKAWKAILDLTDKIQQPDTRFLEAIKAQAGVVPVEKDPMTSVDEDWLRSEDSVVVPEDDLSPIFDSEEEM